MKDVTEIKDINEIKGQELAISDGKPKTDKYDKYHILQALDPRLNSVSHKLYKECENLLIGMFKQAKKPDATIKDKARVINTFTKFRKDLFTDVHFLMETIKNQKREHQKQIFMLLQEAELDAAVSKKIDPAIMFD